MLHLHARDLPPSNQAYGMSAILSRSRLDVGANAPLWSILETTVLVLSKCLITSFFPYALEAIPDALRSKWEDPEFVPYRDAFPAEHKVSPEAFQAHVQDLMARDVKVSYLKALQGYLWESGYKAGQLKAPLFDDVPPRLREWKQRGLEIIIYSSGSVPAQKLLFKYTNSEPADLNPLISDYFDTVNAGLKTEVSSYAKIAAAHDRFPPGSWLFLSDNVKEVEAAKGAGMKSFIVQRPGNSDLPVDVEKQHKVISSFDEISPL